MRTLYAIISFAAILGILVMPALAGGLYEGAATVASGPCMHSGSGEFVFGAAPQPCCVWLEGKLAAKKLQLSQLKNAEGADKNQIEELAAEVEELESRIFLEEREQALSPAEFFYGYPIESADSCNC